MLPKDAQGVAMRSSKAAPPEASAGTAESQTPQGQDLSEDVATAADLHDDSSLTEKTTSTVDVATDTLTTNTPESAVQHSTPSLQKTSSGATPTQPSKTTPRQVAPAVPVVPALPKDGAVVNSNPATGTDQTTETASDDAKTSTEAPEQPKDENKSAPSVTVNSWSALFKRPSAANSVPAGSTPPNGAVVISDVPRPVADGTATVVKSSTASLADILNTYEVRSNDKLYFIEPRALKNRGTDCYMNSVSVNPFWTLALVSPARIYTHTVVHRSYKYLSSACPSITSCNKYAGTLFTVSRTRHRHP